MDQSDFDICIIGAGPGGYVAAIRASQLGLKTAVIEREHLGGICLNWGCIPTKALLRSSEINHLLHQLKEFGLSAESLSFDLEKIVQRSRKVAGRLSQGVAYLLKKNKVSVIDGAAKIVEKGVLEVTKGDEPPTQINTKHIILGTGARARTLPGLEPDGKHIWTYKDAMIPGEMPKSVLVIGSGAIGIEFASFYRTLGADVSVVEILDRILPVEDEDISKLAEKAFKSQGMTIHTGTSVEELTPTNDGVSAVLKSKDGSVQNETFQKAILAIGITGNIENLGLENLGIETSNGHIVIDEWCKTNVDGIYAIGDVAGPPWLAHKASHEGILCVEKIAGVDGVHPLKTENVPGCTYCWPQVASIGLTEAEAKKRGHEVRVGRFPFQANGKAIALGEPDGLIKTIFDDKSGALLGAHMIGAEVTELIQGFAIAKTLETTEQELMHTIFPHPTLSEMMHESVLDAYGRVIHY